MVEYLQLKLGGVLGSILSHCQFFTLYESTSLNNIKHNFTVGCHSAVSPVGMIDVSFGEREKEKSTGREAEASLHITDLLPLLCRGSSGSVVRVSN